MPCLEGSFTTALPGSRRAEASTESFLHVYPPPRGVQDTAAGVPEEQGADGVLSTAGAVKQGLCQDCDKERGWTPDARILAVWLRVLS